MINNQIDNKNNDSVLSNQPELQSLKKENNSAVINLERIINFEKRKKRKKINIIFKKLITKKDFLHLHAISGASFLLLGTALVVCMILNDINLLEFNEIRFLNSPIFVVAILIALVNALTAFPLMRLLTPYHNPGDKVAKKAMTQSLISLGLYYNLLLIWQCFRFSNFFPIVLSFTDKVVMLPLFFIIFKGLYSSCIFLEREVIKDSFYTKSIFYTGVFSMIIKPLTLLPLLISGQTWIERISSLYPLESLLYVKISLFLLLTLNIYSFAVTLLSKKIINYKILSIINLLPVFAIPFAIFELIKYKEETTFNFFIGMF